MTAYARLVEAVDEVHEIVGRPVPARAGKIPHRLVAPGLVKGVLAHRHKLDVRVAHLLHIRHERFGELPVRQPPPALFGHPAPGAEMDLVNGHGRLEPVSLRAASPIHRSSDQRYLSRFHTTDALFGRSSE